VNDAGSILTLFKSVTGIKDWSGCVAMGVCANGAEYFDMPAISVLIGDIPKDKVRSFHAQAPDFKRMHAELEPWLNKHDPMLVIAHADPHLETHPAQALEDLDALVGGFMVGGLCSSRDGNAIIAHDVMESGISGFVFSSDVAVATSLSQGCTPLGSLHEISKGDDHVIAYLDGRKPMEVFAEDLRSMAQHKTGFNPDDIVIEHYELGADIPEGLEGLFRGEAHIAFPVPGSDRSDYMVRNIIALDPETGVMAVGEKIEDGQRMMFVHRDDDSVKADLSRSLVELRERIVQDQGDFRPRAALYVSCIARAGVAFGNDLRPGGEMALIRDILGDIPLAGFYATGEISNTRIYGYTGILTLFL